MNVLREAGQAALGLFTLPYFYIAVLLAAWHARQGSELQRKLFHVRLYGTLRLTIARVLAGLAVGAVLSAASLAAGSELNGGTLLCVWIAMALLALFRLRYVCLAYAAGALGLLQAVLAWTGADEADAGAWNEAVRFVTEVDVPGLLFLAGILHIGEGILVRWQAAKQAVPLFIESKRGKPKGAYALSGVWPIPLLWLVPSAAGASLPWTPLFAMGDGGAAAWSFLAFPVLIGFSDRTSTRWPEDKAKTSGNLLLLYGVAIAALAAGAVYWEPLGVVAAVAAFVLHEGLVLYSRSRENGREPVFSNDGSGVRILAVLPGTPAADMGFLSGEIIRKTNGVRVRTKEELHAALQLQAAFCKLEVVNRAGEVRFVQRARYEGEHYQLGLILAPDEDADFVAAPRSASLWQGLRDAGARRRRTTADALSAAQAEMAAAADEPPAPEVVEVKKEDEGLPPRPRSKRP